MKTLNNYQLEITREPANGEEEKFYQDEFEIEEHEQYLGESEMNGGFAYDAFVAQINYFDLFSLEKEYEELRAEMREEAIEEDYEKMKDMLNELRAEEYEALESARAEREHCEQQFIEHCAIEQADKYELEFEQIECDCSKCKRDNKELKEQLQKAIDKLENMNDLEFTAYLNNLKGGLF